jgi:hypothetical protein
MRCSDMATILFLLSGVIPVTATAQQIAPDPNQPSQVRPQQTPAQLDQGQTSNTPAQADRTPQQSGQAQTQNTPVEPPRTPQQSDQARERERRSAEDTRINRDWTTRQRGAGERVDMDRMRQQMERMMEDEDHRTTGKNWHRYDDDMDRGPRYGSMDRDEGRYYYETRPRSRVKICIEYENGDEFCRYRD